MCYGNERFIQYLASSNTNFQLSNFLDKSGVHGKRDPTTSDEKCCDFTEIFNREKHYFFYQN